MKILLILILLFSCLGFILVFSSAVERWTFGYIMSKFKGDASVLGGKIDRELEEHNLKNRGCLCGCRDFEEWRTGSDGLFTMVHTYYKCKKCGGTHNSRNPLRKNLHRELGKAGISFRYVDHGLQAYWWGLSNAWGAVVGAVSILGVSVGATGLAIGLII